MIQPIEKMSRSQWDKYTKPFSKCKPRKRGPSFQTVLKKAMSKAKHK